MEKELEIIKQLYDGINRKDIDAVMNLLDENITRVEFEGTPDGGTYKGHTVLRYHILVGRNSWAEGACEPVEIFPHGDKFVVTVHVKVLLKNNQEWIDAYTTDGFALKDGRITEFHSFTDKQKAFDWAANAA